MKDALGPKADAVLKRLEELTPSTNMAVTDTASNASPSKPTVCRTLCRPDFSVGESPLNPKKFGDFKVKLTKEEFEIKKQPLPFQSAWFYMFFCFLRGAS